jgi:hypothetical protein
LESGGGGAKLGFRPEADDGPDRWAPPVQRADARAAGCGLGPAGPRREKKGFGPTFGPKPKEDFLKPFSI